MRAGLHQHLIAAVQAVSRTFLQLLQFGTNRRGV